MTEYSEYIAYKSFYNLVSQALDGDRYPSMEGKLRAIKFYRDFYKDLKEKEEEDESI